nr:sulfite exporter TauE/SafE family protein [Verrucomicrobiota bacterium]
MLPPFPLVHWLAAIVAALCIGLSKSGFPGVGLITVIIFAALFPPLESTGILLPLLVCGDICAVVAFRKHAHWGQIWRMLPPTLLGIIAGYVLMRSIPAAGFGPIIGWLILLMVSLQSAKKLRPALYEHVPHTRGFAWAMGAWAGVTTMLANAAGPVMSLYFLAVNLPKYEFVGTSAWFFLLVNVFKIPFSA